MKKEEYLKKCNKASVKDLTDDEVKKFFMPWNPDASNVNEAMYATSHIEAIGKDKLISAMRTALEDGKTFRCYWVEHKGLQALVQ